MRFRVWPRYARSWRDPNQTSLMKTCIRNQERQEGNEDDVEERGNAKAEDGAKAGLTTEHTEGDHGRIGREKHKKRKKENGGPRQVLQEGIKETESWLRTQCSPLPPVKNILGAFNRSPGFGARENEKD